MTQPITLIYRGSGADLTFRSGGARRRVLRGVPFEVDESTATILLSDPAVERFVPEQAITVQLSSASPEVPLEEMTVTNLKVLATSLGLSPKARATKGELVEEITAAFNAAKPAQETTLMDAVYQAPVSGENAKTAALAGDGDQEEDEAPASDPIPRPGSITLEDIPASARIQKG